MQFNFESHVVLWSPSQKTFHIESVRSMIITNLSAFRDQREIDFIVMAISGTREEADEACAKLRSKYEEPGGT